MCFFLIKLFSKKKEKNRKKECRSIKADICRTTFQREALPILPAPFLLTVRKIKKDKSHVPDNGALKQLKIIEQVIGRCDSIIVATDAGREGELIFRYIYEYLKCRKPFERLWISSLTEKAIKQGFDNLKAGSDFDGLYKVLPSTIGTPQRFCGLQKYFQDQMG